MTSHDINFVEAESENKMNHYIEAQPRHGQPRQSLTQGYNKAQYCQYKQYGLDGVRHSALVGNECWAARANIFEQVEAVENQRLAHEVLAQ